MKNFRSMTRGSSVSKMFNGQVQRTVLYDRYAVVSSCNDI